RLLVFKDRSQITAPTTTGTASFASLRLQQRNEIMESRSHHVKAFLQISFETTRQRCRLHIVDTNEHKHSEPLYNGQCASICSTARMHPDIRATTSSNLPGNNTHDEFMCTHEREHTSSYII
ncbi:hypothetical protein, partial [Paraburkholderia antibiotica]|uniref:hypothetical protein n=1 Tax=Paraburkholderia antibiotica TaxID=2728839 RepID=UPI00197F661C